MSKADRIRELLAKGLAPDVIAERLGCPQSSVRSARYHATQKGRAKREEFNATRRSRRRGAA
jgi:DNA-directed RNA polymerase specialized sigma24 family protein